MRQNENRTTIRAYCVPTKPAIGPIPASRRSGPDPVAIDLMDLLPEPVESLPGHEALLAFFRVAHSAIVPRGRGGTRRTMPVSSAGRPADSHTGM